MAKMTKELQFKVLIEQDENGVYVASVPELPGCYTQGRTLEEVRDRVREVIQLVLESEKEVVYFPTGVQWIKITPLMKSFVCKISVSKGT